MNSQDLTAREKEVLSLIVKGCGDKEISENLHVSFTTIRTHVQSIFTKTGAKNRKELIVQILSEK